MRALVGVTVLALTAAISAHTIERTADPAAAAFTAAVERYVALRARLEAPLPAPRSAWSALLTKRYLAAAIRAARRDARPGAIFTPEVAAMFRRTLATAVTPAARRLILGGTEEEGGAPIPLVNEPTSHEWLTALPLGVVHQLPPLPDGLSYYTVGTALVLWDDTADIVVDVLVDAIE